MPRPTSKRLLAIAALLFLVTIGLQTSIDPDRKYFRPIQDTKQLENIGSQSKELLGGVLLGFREVAAGLLWVRADDYFHSGKYDELVPLFYIVTWLDPHQLDVYSTGAWHLAYNLGDQRLIPEGVKFLQKGIRDNPKVYDLYFQEGWLLSNKVKDYGQALEYYRKAATEKGDDGKPAPFFIDNTIAHDLAKDGQIDAMFKQWEVTVAKSRAKLDAARTAYLKDHPKGDPLTDTEVKSDQDALDVQLKNYDTDKLRRDFFRKGIGQPGYAFDWTGKPSPHWTNVGDGKDHRLNAHFNFSVAKIGHRKLKVTGHIEGMDFYDRVTGHHMYTRLVALFRDKDYDRRFGAHADDFAWQKANLTWYRKEISFPTQDASLLKKGQRSTDFEFVLDFSKDPEEMDHSPTDLFPFKTDEYEFTLKMDPTDQSPFHQDVFGWKGEGITDDRYLVTDPRGVRILSKTVTLKRSDVI